MSETRMHPDWRCPRCGRDGDDHGQEERPGTRPDLRTLGPNEAVAWGDGRSTHLLVTCLLLVEP